MSATLFENARFHTGRTADEVFEFMLVEKGRIKKLSHSRPVSGSYRKSVDLGGRMSTPV